MSDDSMVEETGGPGVSVTIKYGKSYEHTWAGFRGSASEVRNELIEFFGLDRASVAELTAAEVVLLAQQTAHALQSASGKLGAVPINRSSSASDDRSAADSPPWSTDDQASTGSVFDQARAQAQQDEPPADPNAELYSVIDRQTDVASLKRVWAENQAAFAGDAKLMDAYKAKGKALSKAAKS